MTNAIDPFGIYSDRSQPRDETLRPTGNGGDGNSGPGWLVVGLLLGLVLVIGYQRFTLPDDGDRKQDQHEQRDDKKQDDRKQQDDKQAKLDGKTLIFVHERNPQPIEHDLLLRQMDDYTKEHGLAGGYRAMDDDMQDEQTKSAIAFAKSKGIDPPFVLMTGKDDLPVRVIKWPAGVDGLGELFK